MAETPESHTIRLLQEMRQDIQDLRASMDARFESVLSEMHEQFDETNGKIDALTHMTMLLARNAADHEARLEALEEQAPR
jgi:hypothetical protein